ncbi:MAG: TetR/AcrR family transcriptional regulator [Petrimonas sp.]|jgi:AcrR family transcriptional regulator|nr:MAG: HTH-type transcriptional repressor KstR2 [Bacteroidetes bacterium ADurb.BinA174]
MALKERIIKEAGSLFYQYGIKSVSMDDLASSLGISKRTLYENFKDKEEILLTYLADIRNERNNKILEVINRSANMIEVFLYFIEIHKKKELPSVKFYEDIYKYYPRVYNLIQKDIEENKIYIKEYLQQGIAQGYIRENLNVDVAAFLVEESTYTYIRASYLEKPPFSFQELFFTMMINFIRGISTEKGIKIVDAYLEKISTDKDYTN